MKYKVISLILIIPIVLMFCVFSASNIAALKVPINVNGVTVFNDSQEMLNLVEGNSLQINAQVYPKNASNKGLIYSYEAVKNKPLAELEISDSGLITAKKCGAAKIIITTKESAYKKSFILEVTSTKATDMFLSLSTQEDLFVGDTFTVFANIFPSATLDKTVKFSSLDTTVLRVNELTGECNCLSSGTTKVIAKLENGINGEIEKEISVTILPNISNSLITFDGKTSLSDNIFSNQYSAIMEVNFTSLFELNKTLSIEDILLTFDNTLVDNLTLTKISNDNGVYKYKLDIINIKSDNFNIKARLNFDNYLNYFSEINLHKVVDLNELEINLSNFKSYVQKNTIQSFNINILPADFTNYTLDVYFTGSNIVLNKVNNEYRLKGNAEGDNVLVVDVIVDDNIIKTFTKNITVVDVPTSINLLEATNIYGIEDLFTIGSLKIENNEYVENLYEFSFASKNVDTNYVQFTSSNNNIAKFENNKLKILGEGKVIITATELKSNLIGSESVTSEVEIRCVNGVMVDSYSSLVKATEDNKQVVLATNIMLGEKLIKVNNDGTTELLKTHSECEQILKSEVKQIETTSEWGYYKNTQNKATPPLINYIIKFTNNCYGNGYVLNADNITNMLDGSKALYDFAVFKGPLDLVAIPNASVKAQDNICFLVSDNVIINNVELVGKDIVGTDMLDLNDLNYAGTVVEVMGDNVKIVNSKIRNGRNCIRVFGKESGNYDKINVLIESCIISTAREFLVKMGTNAKIYGEFKDRAKINLANGIQDPKIWEECSPKINNYQHLNDGNLTNEEYNNLVNQLKADDNFTNLIKTNLTIKNSVLHTSGLFSVGVETSFAGPALDGGRYNSWNFTEYGWKGIAGTSYPTSLNLEGNVRIYDWKKISNIDSTVLIEGDLLKFDIATMISNLYNQGQFTDIITEVDGEKYAHGGIVMYGGGKNYCLINNNLQGVENFNNYSIGLDSLNNSLTNILKYASGREHFRMFMYGKNSEFNYYKQLSDIDSKLAFEITKAIF